MIRLSDILEKSVLSVKRCEKLGVANGILLSGKCKKTVYISIKREGRGEDGATLVPFKEITVGNDALMVYDDALFLYSTDLDVTLFSQNPLGKSVFTRDGTKKGEITDLILGAGGRVVNICTPTSDIQPQKLAGVGEFYLLSEGRRRSAPKRSMPAAETDVAVSIFDLSAVASPQSSDTPSSISELDGEIAYLADFTDGNPAPPTDNGKAAPLPNLDDENMALSDFKDEKSIFTNNDDEVSNSPNFDDAESDGYCDMQLLSNPIDFDTQISVSYTAANSPTADGLKADGSMTDNLTADGLTADSPATDGSSADDLTAGSPTADKQAEDSSMADGLIADDLTADSLTADGSTADSLATDGSTARNSMADGSTADYLTGYVSTADNLATGGLAKDNDNADDTLINGASACALPDTLVFAKYTPQKAVRLNGGADEPSFSMAAIGKIAGDTAMLVFDENGEHTPSRIICEYGFLLGRKLSSDLKNFAGSLLAPKGSTVTDDLVKTARKYGKLAELTLLAQAER
jgi:hypothetical protein